MKRLVKLFCLPLLLLLFASGASAHHGKGAPNSLVTALNYLGVNVFTDVAYYSNEQPFLNIFKQAGSNTPFEPWFTRTASNGDTNEEAYLQVAQTYKWTPGPYGLTFGQPISHGATYAASYTAGDVSQVEACSVCAGYTMWMYWAGLESATVGNWQFQGCTNPQAGTGCGTTFFLDQMLNDLRSHGKKAILVVFDTGSFNAGTSGPTQNDNGALPGYLTSSANTGTYGTGQTGCGMSNPSGAGGFWANESGSYSANIENPNVQARLIALVQRLAAVYDNDPAVEGVMFQAMDFHYPCNTLPSLAGTAYYTAWKNIISAARTAFKHTSVSIQVAFDETGDAQSENFTNWLVTNGGMVSASDTYGATAWTGYQENASACLNSGGNPFSGAPSGLSGTLTSGWFCDGTPATSVSGNLFAQWKLGNTAQVLSATVANNSTAASWTPTITGSPTNAFTVNPAPMLQVTQGMQAWFGISPRGSGYSLPATPLQNYSSSWPLIEAGDMCAGGSIPGVGGFPVNYNPADILTALNNTGINGYAASHPSFTILSGSQCTANSNAVWSNVVTALTATALTNTSLPSVYGSGSAVLDADDYPTTMTAPVPGGQVYTTYETAMNVNIIADTPLPGSSCTYAAACSAITYQLKYEGIGTINLVSATAVSCGGSCSGLTITGTQIVSTNAWPTVQTVTFQMSPSNGLRFQITALPDPNNYIKGVSIVDSTYAAQYAAGEIFHPSWLAAMNNNGAGGFARMRTQVLTYNSYDVQLSFSGTLSSGTNSGTLSNIQYEEAGASSWPFPTGSYSVVFGTGQLLSCTFTYNSTAMTGCSAAFSANILTSSPGAMAVASIIPSWSQRPKLSNATWSTWTGTPLEVIVQACNEVGMDCWFNIPVSLHVVDNSYAACATGYTANLAALIFNGSCANLTGSNISSFTGLNPAHVAYIEYGNEVAGGWNGGQPYTMGTSLLAILANADGFGTARTQSAEEYGKQVAGIGDIFSGVYGGSLTSRAKIVMATQFAPGNGVGFMNLEMNTPDWSSRAYTHHVSALSFAPYMPLTTDISSADVAHLIGLGSQATQLTELFSLAYTNIGNSGHTYPSIPTAGWIGDTFSSANGTAGMISGWSTQPWAGLPIACYEGGLNADNTLNTGDANYNNWSLLLTAALRDNRMQYVYEDPTHQLSSNPGYLQALKNQGITVNKVNLVAPTTAIAGFGGWGALENINQPTFPLSISPPAYQGLMNFVLQ